MLELDKKLNPISEALRLLRIYSDINQGEMADYIGFKQNILSQMEKNKREITIKTLEKYAEFFKIQVRDIMFFAEQIKNNKDIKKDIFKSIVQMIKEGI